MTLHSVQQAAPDSRPPVYSAKGLSGRDLRLAHEYIIENLGERMTPDDLARAIGLSRFHFSRMFVRTTGESPMRYVQRCRVEHAKRLIRQGELLMTEIAVSVGFYDQSHFTRWFRKLVGMTPREFAHSNMECG
ncbi:MAG TPA: AraC family transcriptional regulator [Steroidobacter sp.]|uniref:helix-turn-helix transcriptional regulator n=1 Tax=Steroidobacter sp. TaxID=1978227 RepID=UPI002EDB253B